MVSTTGFRSAGYIVIDTELIQYTSITATSFVGITRGVQGSTKDAHLAGAGVGSAQITPAGVPAVILLDVTTLSNGVTLNAPTGEVTIVNAGTYNITFSIQAANFGNAFDDVAVWYAIGGVNLPVSASYSTVSQTHAGKPGSIIMQVSLYRAFAAGEKLTIKWATITGTIGLVSYPPVNTSIPAAPAIILNVNQIALMP